MTHVPWHGDKEDLPQFKEVHGIESVELLSVGIDIGTTTTHLMFSEMVARRRGGEYSSEFQIGDRETVYESPIKLTPYVDENVIDTEEIEQFIERVYEDAEYESGDVNTGAVITTGEASRKQNAEAITEMFSEQTGKFVCATAGANLEALMAAHGSGAVDYSVNTGRDVLHLDVGGGTTKFAHIDNGFIEDTASLNVGARLLAFDDRGRQNRIEEAARKVADSLEISLEFGDRFSEDDRGRIADRFAELIFEVVDSGYSSLAEDLLVTDKLTKFDYDVLTFSGGAAEYIYDRSPEYYNDLGPALGQAIIDQTERRNDDVAELEAGIRATAIGSTQRTVQVSGNTITVTDDSLLPLRNVPIVPFVIDRDDEFNAVVDEIETKLEFYDVDLATDGFAFGFHLHGSPTYDFLDKVVDAAIRSHDQVAGVHPFILIFEADVAMNAGQLAAERIDEPVISVDGIELEQFGYMDVGEPLESTESVPITVKSLLFEG